MLKRLFCRLLPALFLVGPLPALATQAPNHVDKTITLAATTATAMTMLPGMCAYHLYNGDAATVYWGFTSSVTDSTGTPITAGTPFNWTLSYQSSVSGTTIYLYSVAGTSAGAVKWRGAC